jgi:hypothetical protein
VYTLSRRTRHQARAGAAATALVGALALAACGSSDDSSSSSSTTKAASTSNKPVRIAYLSFAVANSYDAPMLAAAQTVAKENNSTIKVFDANTIRRSSSPSCRRPRALATTTGSSSSRSSAPA